MVPKIASVVAPQPQQELEILGVVFTQKPIAITLKQSDAMVVTSDVAGTDEKYSKLTNGMQLFSINGELVQNLSCNQQSK